MTDTTGTEPFRFTDADGDYLHIGIPTSPTTGHPAISFCTLAEPVHVPMEQIEGLITALRRLVAAQSAVSPAAVEPPADQTTPSHRAALRDRITTAISKWHRDPEQPLYEQGADAVLTVLSREWPWLRAEAEDAAPPAEAADRDRIAAAALAAVETALRDTLTADARAEALAGIMAVLPEPADRAALRAAADRMSKKASALTEDLHDLAHFVAKDRLREAEILDREATELRRLADETATETPTADLPTLAAALDGLHTLIATSSRDWGTYRVDAWLWAVLCGWDCEETEHDDTCVHGSLEEMASRHGWDDEAVAKARRYRAAVRAVTEHQPAAGARQDGGRP